jgi:hypothetical protein
MPKNAYNVYCMFLYCTIGKFTKTDNILVIREVVGSLKGNVVVWAHAIYQSMAMGKPN